MNVTKRYRHRKTGVVVTAARLDDDNAAEVSNWAGGAQIVEETHALNHEDKREGLNVKTPDGKKRCSLGMFVVQYNDDFWVVGPQKFHENYQEE